MKVIKKVIRKHFAETNSSSTHSLAIDMSDLHASEAMKLNMDPETGHIVVEGKDYCWGWEKTNNVNEKLSYVCAQIYTNFGGVNRSKKLNLIRKVVLDFTGAAGLDFPSTFNTSVDPQSSDLIDEIMETKKTIRNFIFNPKSWLYLGDDVSDPPTGFYRKNEVPKYYARIYFPEPVGRLDVELENLPKERTALKGSFYENIDSTLTNIVIDVASGYKVIGKLENAYFQLWKPEELNVPPKVLYFYGRIINGEVYWLSNALWMHTMDVESTEDWLSIVNKYPYHFRKYPIDFYSVEFDTIL